MLRIGLSYHNGDPHYDAYATALEARAAALGVRLELLWLAGKDRPVRSDALRGLDGLCLTGGADVDPARYGRGDAADLCTVDERRDEIEWALLEHVASHPVPLLAVCRGAQLLNVFHGGTLTPDLGERNAVHRGSPIKEHEVVVAEGTLLAECVGAGTLFANSSHHQAVERVAEGFRVSGRAPDGTIEAFERTAGWAGPFTLAVQWHPELMIVRADEAAVTRGLALAEGVLDGFLAAASHVRRA